MKKKNEQNYLDNIPIKNENYTWDVDDEIVTIHMENKGIYNRVAQKFFGTPKVSHIALDEFGSFVWLQIDGKRNIYEIGQIVKATFGKEVEPLYERLSRYFYSLKSTKFITFAERDKI